MAIIKVWLKYGEGHAVGVYIEDNKDIDDLIKEVKKKIPSKLKDFDVDEITLKYNGTELPVKEQVGKVLTMLEYNPDGNMDITIETRTPAPVVMTSGKRYISKCILIF